MSASGGSMKIYYHLEQLPLPPVVSRGTATSDTRCHMVPVCLRQRCQQNNTLIMENKCFEKKSGKSGLYKNVLFLSLLLTWYYYRLNHIKLIKVI